MRNTQRKIHMSRHVCDGCIAIYTKFPCSDLLNSDLLNFYIFDVLEKKYFYVII